MADDTSKVAPVYPTMDLRAGTSMSLDGGYNRLRVCRYGLMLYNKNDLYVGRSLDLYGEFSEGEADMFRQLIRPGDTVMDIGANLGAHTLPLAKFVGPEGMVFAFEPQRLLFQTLCANMALNSITWARCYFLALGESDSVLTVPYLEPNSQTNFGGLGLGNYRKGEPVKVARVDGFELERCRFMKIDVEGMELGVLKGAQETIKRLRPALYVENDRDENAKELVRFIDGLGYNLYWHRPMLFNENNFMNNPENIFKRTISQNMLCLHKDAKQAIKGLEPVPVK